MSILMLAERTISQTTLVYTLVFILVSMFALNSQKVCKSLSGVTVKTNIDCYIIAVAIMLVFTAIVANGADYKPYILIYQNASFSSLSDTNIEFGYQLLNMLLKVFIPDARIGVAIIKMLTVLIFAMALYKLRKKILIGIGLIAYMAITYYSAFNIIRINLAASIVIYGFAVFIMTRRYRYSKFLLAILLGTSIHYTAISVMLLWVIMLIYDRVLIKDNYDKKIIIIAVITIIGTIVALFLIPILINNIPFLQKYKGYLNSNSNFGIGQFFLLALPYFMFFELHHTIRQVKDTNICGYMTITLFVSTAIFFSAYSIGMLSRLEAYFNLPYYICMGYVLMVMEKWNVVLQKKQDNTIIVYKIFVILYFIIRFALFMNASLGVSGIENLRFIWEVAI